MVEIKGLKRAEQAVRDSEQRVAGSDSKTKLISKFGANCSTGWNDAHNWRTPI